MAFSWRRPALLAIAAIILSGCQAPTPLENVNTTQELTPAIPTTPENAALLYVTQIERFLPPKRASPD
jgi:PBP1b-binding outer membrane lipoprotein LpoB